MKLVPMQIIPLLIIPPYLPLTVPEHLELHIPEEMDCPKQSQIYVAVFGFQNV